MIGLFFLIYVFFLMVSCCVSVKKKKTQLLAFAHVPIPSESDAVLPRSFPIVCLQAVRIVDHSISNSQSWKIMKRFFQFPPERINIWGGPEMGVPPK